MPDHAPADSLSACPRYSFIRSTALLAMTLLVAGSLAAQTLTVYDESVQNGFLNYSYGGGFDFASTAQAHSPTHSIAFTINHYTNGVSFARPGSPVNAAAYPVVHFWIHGGSVGGQQLHLFLQLNGGAVANASLNAFIAGGAIVANQWNEVTVPITQAPLSYNGSFDRIDLTSDTDTTQPVLYIDDVTLTQSAPQGAVAPLAVTAANVAGMDSDNFTWQDSLGNPRVATLAYNIDPAAVVGPGGSRGGALRQYSYKLTDGTTRTATVTTYGNGGYGGFGYVVSHSRNRPCATGDDSPLGFVFGGTSQLLFEGRHHAIFRFTQLYPRNCDGTQAPVQRFVPVTIDWVFSTGHDNPLWSVTYDVDLIATAPGQQAAPANTYFDDSRAPYGELNIDGDGGTDLNGVAWGDRYKFTTTNAAGTAVNWDSPFNWTATNTVPYVQEWLDGPLAAGKLDATMGIVQTQTITQQDAGGARDLTVGSDITPYWHKTQADGVHSAGAHVLPNGDNWPYQAMGDNISCNCGLNNARMTWKTQYGFIGQSAYTINGGAVESSATTAPGYPKKSYSTYIVLGQRTTAPVEAQVAQVETIQSLTLTAATGSVVTSGPAGITRADNVTYAPAGYNHVYGALAFNAAGNALDANISVGAGTLKKPMFIIGSYTAGVAPTTVRLSGVSLTADADYFASVRASANELWLTLNRDLTGATNRLEVIGGAGSAIPSGLMATATSISHVDVTWTAASGGGPYDVYRKDAVLDWRRIAQNVAATTFAEDGLTQNTTYVYKVTVAGGSSFSNFDAATTTMFTDDPLNGGTAIKLAHITQLRTAVNAMRAVNHLGDYAFTDAALTTSTPIRAAHVNDLRTALTAARSSLSLTALVYTDDPVAAPTTLVKAQHIIELRNGVK